MRQPKRKETKAQAAAARKNIAGARAAQAKARITYERTHHGHTPPRSKAQQSALRKAVSASAAARSARARGKKPAPVKKRAAIMPEWERELVPETARLPGYSWVLGCNDEYPTCAAAAVANHLLAATGLQMAEHEVLELHKLAGGSEEGGTSIADVLEYLKGRTCGAGGKAFMLHRFTQADSRVVVAGLMVGLDFPHGSHAVLSHPQGMVSWGRVMPWRGEAEEAWAAEWTW